MSTLATDAERMDAANEHTADKHATDATAKDLPNAAEPTDSAPSSASKARKPKAAKSRQDNAGSASTAMVPIGNGEQTPMGASAITPATGLAGAAASPKNTGISPMRGVNLSPASPHITGQKLLAVPKPVQEEDDEDDDVDEDGDADDDTHDFSFINSRGESTNYLDMSTSTLAGLLKNSKLAVKTAAKKIADSEPWTAIVEQQDEMQAGNLPNTVRHIPTLPCSSALRSLLACPVCAGGQHQGDQPRAHLPQDPREARPERQGGRHQARRDRDPPVTRTALIFFSTYIQKWRAAADGWPWRAR